MTLRRLLAALIAGAALLGGRDASALGLGEVLQHSAIGEPLRITLKLIGAESGLEGACFRLSPGSDQDLPWVRQARLAVEIGPSGTVLVVSSPRPSYHPALMLGVEANCDGHLRREYTLLLPPGAAFSPAAAAKADAAPPPQARRDAPPETGAPPPESAIAATTGPTLAQLAAEQFPNDRAAQRRFISAAMRSDPELFPDRQSVTQPIPADAELDVKRLRRVAEKPPAPRPPKPAADAPAQPATPHPAQPPVERAPAPTGAGPAPAGNGSDRLMLAGSEPAAQLKLSLSLSGGTTNPGASDADRERLRQEQRLIMALDEKIMDQLELANRIRELEQLQAHLLAESKRLEGLPMPPQPALPAAPAVTTTPPAPPPPPVAPSDYDDWVMPAAAGGALAALAAFAALWWRRRSREEEDFDEDQAFDAAEPRLAEDAPAPAANVEIDLPLDDLIGPPDELAAHPDELADTASSMDFAPLDWTPPAALAGGPPPLAEEEMMDEHDSAVELAEIMMSFGRVQGAAQTLADFIRHNPKQGVAPWLKLLDVYKVAGMRGEFEGLTRQLNSTFNVKVVTWDNFDVVRMASESIEQMPHIVARLGKLWPRRECQVYLHGLLRDNRDGTRQGFPLAVVDDILCLLGVLNELVGPFRPRPGDFPEEESAAPGAS